MPRSLPGHLYSCLTKCTPTICPICRGKYKLDRIKKLHVEAAPNATTQGNTTQTAFAEYLQMVAMVSGVEASEEDVNQVATRVEEWINTLPSQHLHVSFSSCSLSEALYMCRGSICSRNLGSEVDDRNSQIFASFWSIFWGWHYLLFVYSAGRRRICLFFMFGAPTRVPYSLYPF